MPRSANPLEGTARKMYEEGKTLVDIAAALKVPQGTVRRWKCNHEWDSGKKKQSERSHTKTNAKKANGKKRGVPKGTVNNPFGLPKPFQKGNKASQKHGGYDGVRAVSEFRSFMAGVFSDRELDHIEAEVDEEQALMQTIGMLDVVIANMKIKIDDLKEKKLVVDAIRIDEETRKFESPEEEKEYKDRIRLKIAAGERLPGTRSGKMTFTANPNEIITRMTQQLNTSINARIKAANALDALHAKRLDYELKMAELKAKTPDIPIDNDGTQIESLLSALDGAAEEWKT